MSESANTVNSLLSVLPLFFAERLSWHIKRSFFQGIDEPREVCLPIITAMVFSGIKMLDTALDEESSEDIKGVTNWVLRWKMTLDLIKIAFQRNKSFGISVVGERSAKALGGCTHPA